MGSPENIEMAAGRAKKYRGRAMVDTIVTGAEVGVSWFLPIALVPAAVTGAKLLYDYYMAREAEMHVKLLIEKGRK